MGAEVDVPSTALQDTRRRSTTRSVRSDQYLQPLFTISVFPGGLMYDPLHNWIFLFSPKPPIPRMLFYCLLFLALFTNDTPTVRI